MNPTDIVAPDITCDIQDMKDKPNTPEIVHKLLDSCISSEETSHYAFLLCDGVKWELATVLPTPALPQSKPAETAQNSLPVPSSSGVKKKPKNVVTKAMPEVIIEEQPLAEKDWAEPSIQKTIQEKSAALAVPSASTATKKKEGDNSFFPKVLSTHVLAKPNEEGRTLSSRLKISFAALTGEHGDLSPAPSTMLLPLYNTNDEWCMVACPAVPEAGLQIPGVNILIPRDAVERTATSAVERKARMYFPLNFRGKASRPIFKKGFGMYRTSQLPNHVFLGPFRSEHLDCFTTIPTSMLRICSKTEATVALPEPLTPVSVSLNSTKEGSPVQ